jgi:hypothetical protein
VQRWRQRSEINARNSSASISRSKWEEIKYLEREKKAEEESINAKREEKIKALMQKAQGLMPRYHQLGDSAAASPYKGQALKVIVKALFSVALHCWCLNCWLLIRPPITFFDLVSGITERGTWKEWYCAFAAFISYPYRSSCVQSHMNA